MTRVIKEMRNVLLINYLTGEVFSRLLRFSGEVSENIKKRRLYQLKEQMKAFRVMPKAYFIGVASFFHVIIGTGYLITFSYLCCSVIIGTWLSITPLLVVTGLTLFVTMITGCIFIEKGYTSGLKIIRNGYLFQLLILVATLLILPFSSLAIPVSCVLYAGGMLFLWLSRKLMNSNNMKEVVLWRISLRIYQYRKVQLQRRRQKK
jgi:hypothetical protein